MVVEKGCGKREIHAFFAPPWPPPALRTFFGNGLSVVRALIPGVVFGGDVWYEVLDRVGWVD